MMSRIGNRQRIAPAVRRIEKRKALSVACPLRGADKGLTLVEILLAVVILSIGVAGVLRAYAGSVRILEISEKDIEAMNLLKGKMAQIEQEAIEGKGLSAGSSAGNFEGDFSDYAWESWVQTGPYEALHELKLVVHHPDKTRQFSVTTYVENKDYEP